MNLITILFVSFFSIAMVAWASFFLLAIRRTVARGRRHREKLAARIDTLRLRRMLAALGIDQTRYTHRVRSTEINGHISNCEQCTQTSACDQRLDARPAEADDIDFCPNQEALADIKQELDEFTAAGEPDPHAASA